MAQDGRIEGITADQQDLAVRGGLDLEGDTRRQPRELPGLDPPLVAADAGGTHHHIDSEFSRATHR